MPLSETEIIGSLAEILSEDANVDPFLVTRATPLTTVPTTEPVLSQILADVKTRFNVRLDQATLLACRNVGDVVAAIQADQP